MLSVYQYSNIRKRLVKFAVVLFITLHSEHVKKNKSLSKICRIFDKNVLFFFKKKGMS